MKRPWLSKTLWVNAIGIAVLYVQARTGYVVPAEDQAALLAGVNLVLRLTTRQPLDWGKAQPAQESE